MITIESLQQKFGIPGRVEVTAGHGNLPKVIVKTPLCSGEVYLHGAHITSWIPAGQSEVIFVSKQSKYEPGKAIRGGIPICFPWFGPKVDNPSAPAHGFVRNKSWDLTGILESKDAVTVSLQTAADETSRKWWPFQFRATLAVSFGRELNVELHVENTGTTEFSFEEALHTYYRVGDVTKAELHGLEGSRYLDKTRAGELRQQNGAITISEETDRVYLDTTGHSLIVDSVSGRSIEVESSNSRTTVVWNPWIQKAKSFTDFGDDEWPEMLCVETSNVAEYAVTLPPGQTHSTSFRASVK